MLEKSIEIAFELSKKMKEKLNLEKEEKKEELRNELKENIEIETRTKIEKLEEAYMDEINKKKWSELIEKLFSNGPNKRFTKYLENEMKIDNNLEFLEDENGEKYYGSEGAKFGGKKLKEIYEKKEIEQEYFEKLDVGKMFSSKSRKYLNKVFTSKEIRKSIRQTPNKSPGPSGIKITLFKKFIDHFTLILKKIANETMKNGETSEFLMNGYITLIPKKENSNKINDLRPITLLEIPRKIITKAMTRRIKKVLMKDKLINENQFSHPGRMIHENVHTLKLLIEKAKENKTNLNAMFLDCMKAFDFVAFEHIKNSLKSRDCGENFWNFISSFLGGKARVKFRGKLSDPFEIGRGTPQRETLSPFLFIFTINPLLNAIDKDENIKGIKVGNKRVKVMAYADDLILLSENKEDLERMLVHVRNYERASNAKLNEKKSQILSFGEEKIERISDIKHCEENERVRHLGFFFNKNGLINNIDEIMEKTRKKLKILKNLFPNFTTRINLWKGYAMSSLIYQSEIITIENKQINDFEKFEKIFLFEKEVNGNLKEMEKAKVSISLKRLKKPMRYGGYNLNDITSLFSASKAKVLMRAMQEENRTKPCYYLLIEKMGKLFESQNKNKIYHPLFTSFVDNWKSNGEWKWFSQANKIYKDIDKDLIFFPQIEQTVYDWHKNKIVHICDEVNKKLYKPKSKTIPIQIEKNEIELYKNYNEFRNEKEKEKIYEMEEDMINKKLITKTDHSTWMENVKLEYLGLKKGEKISLKVINKIMKSNENQKPNWTKKQIEWINGGVNLEKLLSIKLKTIPKIEDFRRKFLMNFWYKLRFQTCPLCKNKKLKFNVEHLLLKCVEVEKWEIKTYGNIKRKKRIEAFWDWKNPNYLASWIQNWSIWRNVWDIKFEIMPHLKYEKQQIKHFKKHLENNEFIHIKMCLEKRKDVFKNKEKYIKETKLFHMCKFIFDTEG